eukprot:TRINITY_DN41810_c0_g1_i1.p1 TRINITY_DN41810_c0_g1~~TRINITY_DN41810_c0_g1_i1.p1  ORF type:complete len:322 (+),score=50.48 TRINITY_DN41810_c0_g1_i1:587-1552(+)
MGSGSGEGKKMSIFGGPLSTHSARDTKHNLTYYIHRVAEPAKYLSIVIAAELLLRPMSDHSFSAAAASALFFLVVGRGLAWLVVCRLLPVPQRLRQKAMNSFVSLTHSTFMAVFATPFFCLPLLRGEPLPDMFEDVPPYRCTYLVAVAVGYFIYDLFDIIRSGDINPFMIAHHIITPLCFTAALAVERYTPILAFSLAVELNSVGLNLRLLLNTVEFRPKSVANTAVVFLRRANFLFTIVTFVAVRLTVHPYILFLVFRLRERFVLWHFIMAASGMALINVFNVVFAWGVVRGELRYHKKAKATKQHKSGSASPPGMCIKS